MSVYSTRRKADMSLAGQMEAKTSESVENEKLTSQEVKTVSSMGKTHSVPPDFGNASPELPHNHPNFSRIDQSLFIQRSFICAVAS
jgi:hypothetical protein